MDGRTVGSGIGRRGAAVLLVSTALLGGCGSDGRSLFDAPQGPPDLVAVSCDLVASPTGSDSAAGTAAEPLRSAQRLVDSLQPGQTGCLRAGTYDTDAEIKLSVPGITLTAYPGEQATLRGRLWVADGSTGSTVSGLNLDGRNDRDLPSPTINGDDVVLSGNDITNHHTSICLSIGSLDTYGRAQNTLVEDNRIHDCGVLPATNYDHGIYVAAADDTVIRGNWIYDNADRGVQLYPDAQRTLVTGNVIDGNGSGVIFSGGEGTASSDNVVEHNVITNSRVRDNVESYWGNGPVGNGNVVRENCIGGGSYDDGDGGILGGGNVGFRLVANVLESPGYTSRSSKDFTLDPASRCGKLLAQGLEAPATPATEVPMPVTDPPPVDPPPVTDPPPASPPPASPSAVTLTTSKRHVKTAKPIKVRGVAPGAATIQIQIHRDGAWRPIAHDSTSGAGRYRTKVAIHNPGRKRIKAVARGCRDSRAVRVEVQRPRRSH